MGNNAGLGCSKMKNDDGGRIALNTTTNAKIEKNVRSQLFISNNRNARPDVQHAAQTVHSESSALRSCIHLPDGCARAGCGRKAGGELVDDGHCCC